jgi:hypothetical protein
MRCKFVYWVAFNRWSGLCDDWGGCSDYGDRGGFVGRFDVVEHGGRGRCSSGQGRTAVVKFGQSGKQLGVVVLSGRDNGLRQGSGNRCGGFYRGNYSSRCGSYGGSNWSRRYAGLSFELGHQVQKLVVLHINFTSHFCYSC